MVKCKIPVGEDRPQDCERLPRVFACKSLNIYTVFFGKGNSMSKCNILTLKCIDILGFACI